MLIILVSVGYSITAFQNRLKVGCGRFQWHYRRYWIRLDPVSISCHIVVFSGYHQESGRAGRDGRDADIVLYFSRADVTKARSLLEPDPETTGRVCQEQLNRTRASLDAMVAYADNLLLCRRVLLLRHFGEEFDAHHCNGVLSFARCIRK